MDVQLFIRSKTGMTPTEAADALAKHYRRLTDIAREAEIEMSAIRGNDGGVIRIGAGQMWSWLFIPKILANFSSEFPAVTLEITTGPMRELMPRLHGGELDVIIGDFDGVHVPEGYLMQHAWSAEFGVFSRPDHPLAKSAFVSAADLVKTPWAGYIDHDVFEHNVRFWCRKTNVDQPHISIKTSSLATMLRVTSAGDNVAVLPVELESEARHWGLVPIRGKGLDLWTVRTGSIVQERRAAIKQYQFLLALIKAVGERPADFLSEPR